MQTFANHTDARNAIFDFPVPSLPVDMVDTFRALRGSPSTVDQIVGLGEFLYARRAEVSDAAKELAGGLIAYATIHAWHGLADNDRGDGIVKAMRRDIGDAAPAGTSWPDKDADPAPLREYLPTEPDSTKPVPA
jgi:hypothetical protein